MRDCAVHRDHRVQMRNDRGGVGKISKFLFGPKQVGQLVQERRIVLVNLVLKTDEADIRQIEQRQKGREADRTIEVVVVRSLARPSEANERPALREALARK